VTKAGKGKHVLVPRASVICYALLPSCTAVKYLCLLDTLATLAYSHLCYHSLVLPSLHPPSLSHHTHIVPVLGLNTRKSADLPAIPALDLPTLAEGSLPSLRYTRRTVPS
jgi:hypothetical protein